MKEHSLTPAGIVDEAFIARVMAELGADDLVSLDIFDTMLTRIVDSPQDAFAEIEKRLFNEERSSYKGIAIEREAAEQRARNKARARGIEDITLDQIYAELSPEFNAEMVCECELKVEMDLLIPSPDMVALTQRLNSAGRRWIIVSDMYLPTHFLGSVLIENGIIGWADMFISGDVGWMKSTGHIWSKIIGKRYALNRLVHIGDNLNADVRVPVSHGVRTIHYPRFESNRRVGAPLNPALLPFSYEYRYTILRQAMQALPMSDKALWKSIGQTVGGLFMTAFLKWLQGRIQRHGVKRLYFCARDGYLIREAWQASGLCPNVEVRYLYTSRRPLQIACGVMESHPWHLSTPLLEYLGMIDGKTTVETVLRRASTDDAAFRADLQQAFPGNIAYHPQARNVLFAILQKHAETIYAALYPFYERTVAYLKQEGLQDQDVKYALVDAGWLGAQQRRLSELTGHPVVGFYFGQWRLAFNNLHKAGLMESAFANPFDPAESVAHVQMAVELLENLCQEPVGTTIDYRLTSEHVWVPVHKSSVSEQEQYNNAASFFQRGTLEAVRALFERGQFNTLWLEECGIEAANAALASFSLSPTSRELRLARDITHSAQSDHLHFDSLVHPFFPVSDAEIAKVLSQKNWTVGTLLHWYHIAAGHEQQEMIRKAAIEKLAYLGERRLRQFWY
jgi:predicted HAD superfamily hydrolase